MPQTEHLVKSYATKARRSSLKEKEASELRTVGPKRLSPLVAPVSPWGSAEMTMSCEKGGGGEQNRTAKIKMGMRVVQLSGDLLKVGDDASHGQECRSIGSSSARTRVPFCPVLMQFCTVLFCFDFFRPHRCKRYSIIQVNFFGPLFYCGGYRIRCQKKKSAG